MPDQKSFSSFPILASSFCGENMVWNVVIKPRWIVGDSSAAAAALGRYWKQALLVGAAAYLIRKKLMEAKQVPMK